MPVTIASVLSFVPTNIWRPLKKFVTKDATVIFDLPFKISTKYTSGLLIVMMCLSFANQFVRNVEMDCSTNGVMKSAHGHGHVLDNTDLDQGLQDFCWNHETFLVVKALSKSMRGKVSYPGVSDYNRERDELLKQRYYKYVWFIFGQLCIVAFLPYFFWKARGVKKIMPLINITEEADYPEEDQRLNYFLETLGMNGGFAWFYSFCKIFATFSPIVQLYYACTFLGDRFRYYGYDVLSNVMDDNDPWPNPMDILFPKMAKCEWARYGYSGDLEVKAAQCLLPMNNITQWSFFVYWMWLVIVFIVNALSLIYLFIHCFPSCRRYKYEKFVAAACRENVDKLRTYIIPGEMGIPIKRKHEKHKVISISLGFGDWLVLTLMKKNLEEYKFRDFIRQLSTTDNPAIQLKAVSSTSDLLSNLTDMTIRTNSDEAMLNETRKMDLGFKSTLIHNEGGISPKKIPRKSKKQKQNNLDG